MVRYCRTNICCLQKPSTQQAWHILVHLVSGGCCIPLLSTPASSANSLLGKLISVYNFPVAAPSSSVSEYCCCRPAATQGRRAPLSKGVGGQVHCRQAAAAPGGRGELLSLLCVRFSGCSTCITHPVPLQSRQTLLVLAARPGVPAGLPQVGSTQLVFCTHCIGPVRPAVVRLIRSHAGQL